MNKALITSILLVFGVAGQAAAAAPIVACAPRGQGETDSAYAARVQGGCEAGWNDAVAHNATGGLTHDQFVNRCAHRCAGAVVDKAAGNQVLLVGGALLVAGAAGGAAAAASGGGHSSPASP